MVGRAVATKVGRRVGLMVGRTVTAGLMVGRAVATKVGRRVGLMVGRTVTAGLMVGRVVTAVGQSHRLVPGIAVTYVSKEGLCTHKKYTTHTITMPMTIGTHTICLFVDMKKKTMSMS
jgi:hypothetical protein